MLKKLRPLLEKVNFILPFPPIIWVKKNIPEASTDDSGMFKK